MPRNGRSALFGESGSRGALRRPVRGATVANVALSDDDLLNFDETRLADYDASEARERLRSSGDVYRAQLVAAHMLAGYRERWLKHVDGPGRGDIFTPDYVRGWDDAMRDVVAHLRQGDFIPGSTWYDQETGPI